MSLTTAQRAHLEERLQDERARTAKLLNTLTAEGTEETEQDQSGDLSKVRFTLPISAAARWTRSSTGRTPPASPRSSRRSTPRSND